MLSNILMPTFFLRVRDKVSQSYKPIGKIIIVCILSFSFFVEGAKIKTDF
jgi:hypothetical protein